MKKLLCLVLSLTLLFPILSSAQSGGKVYDNLTIESKILARKQNYAVYLPPDYETSERSYPVLYLLHGHGDNHTGWVQFGEVKGLADKAILEGTATPMIIVMPDGNNDIIGYFNTVDGKWRWEDYFFEELIPQIEKKYRIRSEKRYRAISGLSMGGGGAYLFALHHPELFSASCVLSGSAGLKNMEDLNFYKHPKVGNLSNEKVADYIRKYNVLQQIDTLSRQQVSSVRWYIDCGDDDFLSIENCRVHIAMTEKRIPHEFRTRNGYHSWSYWREALPEVLRFVSGSFHQ